MTLKSRAKRRQANNRKIRAILHNWKTVNRIEVGFSLNNRAKRAENTPIRLQASSYHRFQDTRLHFTLVRLIGKNGFPCIISMLSTNEAFFNNNKKLF